MLKKIGSLVLVGALSAGLLAGCGANKAGDFAKEEEKQGAAGQVKELSEPIVIPHAYGETKLVSQPERIVTLGWGNQDTVLALGKIPVGVSAANYGYVTDHQLHAWTDEAFADLGETEPNVFNDTDGFDYEAISDAAPDVILAAYSGMTKEEYEKLSAIAPVVPFAQTPWKTSWREQTIRNAEGMAMGAEGEALVKKTEELITKKVKEHPDLSGKTAAFCWISPDDFSQFYVYLDSDPRASYLTDLGFAIPGSVSELAGKTQEFSVTVSRENADQLNDVDVMVVYGDETLLEALQKDELMSRIPAIANGAVVLIDSTSKLAASSTPTILSIPATIDEYLSRLDEAAQKAGK